MGLDKARRLSFTLLELVCVIALLGMAASLVGVKLHQKVVEKRFLSSVEKLSSRLATCRQLSLNMQSDWRCHVYKQGSGWRVDSLSLEAPDVVPLPSLRLSTLEMEINEERTSDWSIDFISTGDVLPSMDLRLFYKRPDEPRAKLWHIPQYFQIEEGFRDGPAHPLRK